MAATTFDSSKVADDVQTSVILQEAISGYTDEAYTNAKKLSGTGIVGSNPDIDTSTETFIGQVRWNKPISPTINTATLHDSAEGTLSSYTTEMYKYIKTLRTHGAEKINMKSVVTQQDGLAKIGRDFGETRAQDEHNAILAVLRGVALSEAMVGANQGGLGGQTFDNDPTSASYGFYVDLGANLVTAATTSSQGAQRAEGFLQAIGKAYKDYEPDYAYLITSPEVMASLRSANLVDQDRVTEGNMDFQTIFQGKFRLIQTRATQGFSSAEITAINGGGVDLTASAKTSFIVLPGALAMQSLDVPIPVEVESKPSTYQGGGTTRIWYRWGNVFHPQGYSWDGREDRFVSDAEYLNPVATGDATTTVVPGSITNTTGTFDQKGKWLRKASSALSLGILPVFHT